MGPTEFDPLRRLKDATEPTIQSKFITPKIGYTVKTTNGSGKKVFINVCSSSEVEAPGGWADGTMPDTVATAIDRLESHEAKSAADLEILRFSTCSDGPREDVDHTGAACLTVDCVINSDLMAHAEHVRRLKTYVTMILLDHVSKKMGVTLDTKYKLPKMRYKSSETHPAPMPQLIRKDPRSLVTEVETQPSAPEFALRLNKKSTVERQAVTPARPPARSHTESAQQKKMPKSTISDLCHTIRYVGCPAKYAILEVKLPAAKGVDGMTVTACGGDVHLRCDSFSLPVRLPFAIDATSSVADIKKMTRSDSGDLQTVVTVRLPYLPYSLTLEEESRPIAVPAH